MSTEGGEGITTGSDATRYHVRSGDREKGPYTLAQLRASLRDGALGSATLVRAEDEAEARPLGEVLGMGVLAEPREPRRAAASGRKSERAAGSVELADVYAPPGIDEPAQAGPDSLASADRGNYWLGFALGFFGGCLALLLSRNAKPETRRGVGTGFVVGLGTGILFRILGGVSRPGH